MTNALNFVSSEKILCTSKRDFMKIRIKNLSCGPKIWIKMKIVLPPKIIITLLISLQFN